MTLETTPNKSCDTSAITLYVVSFFKILSLRKGWCVFGGMSVATSSTAPTQNFNHLQLLFDNTNFDQNPALRLLSAACVQTTSATTAAPHAHLRLLRELVDSSPRLHHGLLLLLETAESDHPAPPPQKQSEPQANPSPSPPVQAAEKKEEPVKPAATEAAKEPPPPAPARSPTPTSMTPKKQRDPSQPRYHHNAPSPEKRAARIAAAKAAPRSERKVELSDVLYGRDLSPEALLALFQSCDVRNEGFLSEADLIRLLVLGGGCFGEEDAKSEIKQIRDNYHQFSARRREILVRGVHVAHVTLGAAVRSTWAPSTSPVSFCVSKYKEAPLFFFFFSGGRGIK